MSNSVPASSSSSTRDRRSFQVFGGRRFSFTTDNIMDLVISACTTFAETFVLILGPLLICFASAIICGLSWIFFTIYLPMMRFDLNQKEASPLRQFIEIGGNIAFVVFILIEIIFNYYMCVTTRNAGSSSSYDIVVKELAESTNLEYPKTPQEVASFRRDFNHKMMIRIRQRQAREAEERARDSAHTRCCDSNGNCSSKTGSSNSGIASGAMQPLSSEGTKVHNDDLVPSSGTENITLRKSTRQQKSTNKKNNISGGAVTKPKTRSWMFMAPDEWGFCVKTNQPKPPRSHYDQVSKTLVLCLDHYCPWMFNASKLRISRSRTDGCSS